MTPLVRTKSKSEVSKTIGPKFLNPSDFYLWGHLKGMVYRERHASVAELKFRITSLVRCVTTLILNASVVHAVLPFQHVVLSGGLHIEHIM